MLKRIAKVTALLMLGFLLALFTVAYRSDIPAEELERRYADGDSQFLDIAGSRVHVKDVGPKDLPPLLLIHGTASSLHTWDGWADALGDRYRVIRFDLPGYGLTGPNRRGPEGRGDYSTSYRLEVIDGLLEALGVEAAAVAGNSLGGFLAWRYAARRPQRVSAGVLINAAGAPRDAAPAAGGRDGDTGFRAIDLATMPVINQLMTRLTPRFLIRDALHQVYGDPSKVDDALIDRHHAMLLREGNRRALVEAATQRSTGTAPPADLAEVRQPMLVMWGRKDTWIPVADAESFNAGLPDSELVIYDDAGHVPMEEIPRRSAADAAAFLGRRLPSTAGEGAPGDHAVPRQEY